MKKFKKIMASIVAVATLGSIAITPVNAIVTIPSSPNDSRVSYYEENAITEAIIIIGDDTYYYFSSAVENPSIDIDSLNLSETDKFNIENENNFPILIDTNSVDISNVSNVIVVEDDDLDSIGRYTIPIREKYCYTDMLYDTSEKEWCKLCSVIEINDEEPTIGASENKKDENGLYSVPTEVRGDVNYDGLVNNIDVMVLRKYILHLIEW